MNTTVEPAAIPDSSQKEQLLSDILLLGMKAHYQSSRCVMIEFYGHTSNLYVSIRESETEYKKELASTVIRFEPYSFFDEEEKAEFETTIIQTLETLKRYLTDLLEHDIVHTKGFLEISTRAS
ncbi:hypothetical protein [Metabacillus sp. SLBN-84]